VRVVAVESLALFFSSDICYFFPFVLIVLQAPAVATDRRNFFFLKKKTKKGKNSAAWVATAATFKGSKRRQRKVKIVPPNFGFQRASFTCCYYRSFD
jgi:hypothetical protein